jgi:hypothetical protein
VNYAEEALTRGWFPIGMGDSAGMARINQQSHTIDTATCNIEACEGLFAHISFAEMDYLTLKWLQFREDGSLDGLPESAKSSNKLNFDLVATEEDKGCSDCDEEKELPSAWSPCISYYPGEDGVDYFEIIDQDGDMVSLPGHMARQYAKLIEATGHSA